MTIKQKLITAFSVITLVFLGVILMSYFNLRQVQSKADDVVHITTDMDRILQLKYDIQNLVFVFRNYASGDLNIRKSLRVQHTDLEKTFQGIKEVKLDKELAKVIFVMANEYKEIVRTISTIPDFKDDVKMQEQLRDRLNKQLDSIFDQTLKLTNLVNQRLNAVSHASANYQTTSLLMLLIGAVLSSVLALITVLILVRSINKPIQILQTATQAMAEGHLDTKLELNSNDEFGQLSESFNNMASKLEGLRLKLISALKNEHCDLMAYHSFTQLDLISKQQLEFIRDLENKSSLDTETFQSLVYIETSVQKIRMILQNLGSLVDENSQNNIKTYSVFEAINHASNALNHIAPDKIQLHCDIKSHLWNVGLSKKDLLNVLINLGLNSVEALTEGGTIELKARNFLASDDNKISQIVSPGSYVWIVIKDNGKGMNQETQQKAFDNFFTTKNDHKGLGLTQTQQTCASAGGTIHIDSQENIGTTIHVFLPATADTETNSTDNPFEYKKAVIVENDPLLKEYTMELIQQIGAQTKEATNLDAVIRIAQNFKNRIDYLFIDASDSNESSSEKIHQFLELRPETKIIYMGFKKDSLDVDDSQKFFLKKPFTAESLFEIFMDSKEDEKMSAAENSNFTQEEASS